MSKPRALTSSRLATCLSAFGRRQDGAAVVEFAMVVTPFLALILGVIQMGLVMFTDQILETVSEKVSRQLLTGIVQQSGANQTALSQAQFQSLVCTAAGGLLNCNNIMVDVQAIPQNSSSSAFSSANTTTPTITFNPNGSVSNVWQYNPGNPGDIVVMRLLYQLPLVSGAFGFKLGNLQNGNRLLIATAVFQNEVYQ